MRTKIRWVLWVVVAFAMCFTFWQRAQAFDENIYPTYGPRTINLGKQGLFLSNPPINTEFVKVEKLNPPLRPKYTDGVSITYRGPALKIQFLNKDLAVVNPWATLSTVYFNISEPELKMWEEWGADEIAIWYYSIQSDRWQICPTRLVPEKANNGKYDRLACFVMSNGIYVLGKMKIDKVFPELFRPYDLEDQAKTNLTFPHYE